MMSISAIQNFTQVPDYSYTTAVKHNTKATDTTNLPAEPAREQTNQFEFTAEEKSEVDDLKKRDREVRAHEHAHKAAGGQYVIGGANFTYVIGPDGRRYASGGEVMIDASEIPNDPEATIRKMQQIKRAALAPANPSSQDHRVAAQASQKKAEAVKELNAQKFEERNAGNNSNNAAQKTSLNITSSYNSFKNQSDFNKIVDIVA